MKAAPISLEKYFATDLAFTANPRFDAAQPVEAREEDFQVNVSAKPQPAAAEARRWQVELSIMRQPAKETNFPYAFRVVLVGQFKVEPWVKPEHEERMISIQGPSVLFGMAREIVRAITGRGPHPPVLLPTVSFYEQQPAAQPVRPAVTTATVPPVKRSRKLKPAKQT